MRFKSVSSERDRVKNLCLLTRKCLRRPHRSFLSYELTRKPLPNPNSFNPCWPPNQNPTSLGLPTPRLILIILCLKPERKRSRALIPSRPLSWRWKSPKDAPISNTQPRSHRLNRECNLKRRCETSYYTTQMLLLLHCNKIPPPLQTLWQKLQEG